MMIVDSFIRYVAGRFGICAAARAAKAAASASFIRAAVRCMYVGPLWWGVSESLFNTFHGAAGGGAGETHAAW